MTSKLGLTGVFTLFVLVILTGCPDDKKAPPGGTAGYTVGGTVSGLTGSVVLQNNGGDNLSISANGAFTFATQVASGSPYSVTVLTQPTGQTCSVANGTGTVSGANVTNITVSCTTNAKLR